MTHFQFRTGLIAATFAALLFFPWVNGQFRLVPDLPNAENRQLAEEPLLFLDSLDSFPLLYNRFYEDNFSLRYSAINLYGQLQYRLFHTSPVPQSVIMGRDGWFFMNDDEQKAYVGDYMFSPDELEHFKMELEYRKEYIERLGGQVLFHGRAFQKRHLFRPNALYGACQIQGVMGPTAQCLLEGREQGEYDPCLSRTQCDACGRNDLFQARQPLE